MYGFNKTYVNVIRISSKIFSKNHVKTIQNVETLPLLNIRTIIFVYKSIALSVPVCALWTRHTIRIIIIIFVAWLITVQMSCDLLHYFVIIRKHYRVATKIPETKLFVSLYSLFRWRVRCSNDFRQTFQTNSPCRYRTETITQIENDLFSTLQTVVRCTKSHKTRSYPPLFLYRVGIS